MRRSRSTDRVLATVLFTDIVGSTERAAELGDRRWRDLVARHHAVVRGQLKRYRGREIDTAGDGFFATFDRPAQAIACALAIVDALRPLGLTIRAGLHAGELELSGGKLGGIAVPTAARVMASAGPGEILVTATVRDLVAGSDIEFTDRGVVALKGVPGEWHLFAVVAPGPAAADTDAIPEPGPVAASRTRARLSRLWAIIGIAAVLALFIIAATVLLPRLFAPPVVPGIDAVARVDASGSAFERSVSVGRRPTALAAGDGAVWVINFDGQTLTRVATDTGLGDDTAVGGSPTGIAYGAGAVWITTGFGLRSGEAGTVVRFSPTLLRSEADIPVGNGAAIAYGDGAVWVADRIREVVLRINPSTNAVEQEVQVGGAPGALAVGAGSIWVASALDGIVQRINTTTLVVEARVPVALPTAIAVGPGAVWVTSELGDTLTRVDTATNTATNFPVGDGPRGVAVAEDAVWVALGPAGQLVRFDPATGDVEAVLEVEGFADAVVIDEDGRVWVSVRRP